MDQAALDALEALDTSFQAWLQSDGLPLHAAAQAAVHAAHNASGGVSGVVRAAADQNAAFKLGRVFADAAAGRRIVEVVNVSAQAGS